MKTYKCTDGFVTKIIPANSAAEAAGIYALMTSTVTVREVDEDDQPVGSAQVHKVIIAE